MVSISAFIMNCGSGFYRILGTEKPLRDCVALINNLEEVLKLMTAQSKQCVILTLRPKNRFI